MRYSIVIPVHDEEGNVLPLYRAIARTMADVDGDYEIVFVDDCSADRTFDVLSAIHAADDRVNVVRLRRNYGQTAALRAGFEFAHGEIVVAMDGDMQDDPAEIPSLLAKIEEGFDIVSAWRRDRAEPWLTRRLPSAAANRLLARLSGIDIHDFGTTFKAYRRELLEEIDLHGSMHRYIPALASRGGWAITEVPVRQNPRLSGRSHYGLRRVPEVALDLLYIKFVLDWAQRPLRFFGALGALALLAALALAGLGTAVDAFAHVTAVAVLAACGVELVALGLLGEIVAKSARLTGRQRGFAVRSVLTRRPGGGSFRRAARGARLALVRDEDPGED
jgi:glycosyltransferase involved in cell wall biosynthesis